jgi:carbamoyltransferase
MLILGINGSVALIDENRFNVDYEHAHDAAAVLIEDGKIIAAFEEERLNRIKHSNKFPILSIEACLRQRNISLEEVDLIAVPMEEAIYDANIAKYRERDPSFFFTSAREFLAATLLKFSKNGTKIDTGKIRFINHHLAHAASAFFVSGFRESLIVTLDGVGDGQSGGAYTGEESSIQQITGFSEKDSLGHFYLDITRLLGFKFFDEYKVMGLAPFGDPTRYRKIFNSLYCLKPNGDYSIDKQRLLNIRTELPGRQPGARVEQCHKDIASAIQHAIEDISFHILEHYRQKTSQKYLCLAGGVALNCSMTGKLRYAGLFDDIFVQPSSHDGGLPLGAALYAYYQDLPSAQRHTLRHMYWGTRCPDGNSTESTLCNWRSVIHFDNLKDTPAQAARLIADGNVIGWFQGASEFGPRALGNRSILADPRPADNRELINYKIKMREGFRPFAPSVLEDEVHKYFELPDQTRKYPYMTFVLNVKEDYRPRLGAITHCDGTARLHTVTKEDNPGYYQLIREFMGLTGFPVLLNTSFNNNVEPIVDTPDQAMACFLTTDLDYLIIDNFVIYKKKTAPDWLLSTYPAIPPFIRPLISEQEGVTRYFLTNTYDRKQFPISPFLYSIYKNYDGRQNFKALFKAAGIDYLDHTASLIREINSLWSLRVLDIRPELVH